MKITIKKVYRLTIDDVPAGGMWHREPIKIGSKIVSYPFLMGNNYFTDKKPALAMKGRLWQWLIARKQQDIIKYNKKAKAKDRKSV